MTFNKSPRNAAVDNYVINTNRGFRWRLICSFDHLLGNWQSLVFLTRSLQIFKGVKPLRMPARVPTPEAAPLHMYVLHTNTYTWIHAHTNFRILRCMFSQTPSWFWHLEPQSCLLLVLLRNLWEWWLRWQREYVSLAEATPGLSDTVTNSLIPADYTNGNLDRMVLGSLSMG